jgi:hypothetical protein
VLPTQTAWLKSIVKVMERIRTRSIVELRCKMVWGAKCSPFFDLNRETYMQALQIFATCIAITFWVVIKAMPTDTNNTNNK